MTVFSLDSSLSVCWFFLFVSQYKEGKKLKPKPNYNSVDLSEVEWEDTEEKVRERNASIDVCLDLQHKCFYNLWQMSWWVCDVSVFQLRTAMVKGDTGTLALDVKATVDKGVSTSSSTTIQWYFTKDILSLSTAFMIFFFFCPSQTRVLFLRNDYFHTDINETPFRCETSLQSYSKCLTCNLI